MGSPDRGAVSYGALQLGTAGSGGDSTDAGWVGTRGRAPDAADITCSAFVSDDLVAADPNELHREVPRCKRRGTIRTSCSSAQQCGDLSPFTNFDYLPRRPAGAQDHRAGPSANWIKSPGAVPVNGAPPTTADPDRRAVVSSLSWGGATDYEVAYLTLIGLGAPDRRAGLQQGHLEACRTTCGRR